MRTKLTGERWVNSKEKRAMDIAASVLLLPIAIPAGAAALALSRIIDGDEAFFAQKRFGRGGESISIRKIRTMRPADPEPGESTYITSFGNIVRPFAIDESPQLANILRGDMSLVGPRAYEQKAMDAIESALPRTLYDEWLDVYNQSRPGGLSSYSINIRGDITPDERTYAAKAKMDIEDFHSASFSHDLMLLRKAAAMGISIVQNKLAGPATSPETA
jgi:lipopolysaccharide/colanic/teichoic acid biosynthesis glycosyltransferase